MSKPLTREFLLERGSCCNNDCKNCPYKNKTKNMISNKGRSEENYTYLTNKSNETKMIEDEDYTKFDELVIETSDEVWWHTTIELKCKWDGKEFVVRDSENPKGREFIWMKGEDQFTQDEMDEIEEYMYSGEIDLEAS